MSHCGSRLTSVTVQPPYDRILGNIKISKAPNQLKPHRWYRTPQPRTTRSCATASYFYSLERLPLQPFQLVGAWLT
jgi:hypothetical protein